MTMKVHVSSGMGYSIQNQGHREWTIKGSNIRRAKFTNN